MRYLIDRGYSRASWITFAVIKGKLKYCLFPYSSGFRFAFGKLHQEHSLGILSYDPKYNILYKIGYVEYKEIEEFLS